MVFCKNAIEFSETVQYICSYSEYRHAKRNRFRVVKTKDKRGLEQTAENEGQAAKEQFAEKFPEWEREKSAGFSLPDFFRCKYRVYSILYFSDCFMHRSDWYSL